MSRLDSFIRRMQAQRACLDLAAAEVAAVPGLVLELGLGNGRTYDHLREALPGRAIHVFDRQVNAHPACIPPDDRLWLGDIRDTLSHAVPTFGAGSVALVHSDIGTGDAAHNAALAAWLGPMLAPLLAPGGLVLADQALDVADWVALDPPAGVAEGRYFLYRRHV